MTETRSLSQAEVDAYWADDCETCNRPRKAASEFCSAAHLDVASYHLGREAATEEKFGETFLDLTYERDHYRMALQKIAGRGRGITGWKFAANEAREALKWPSSQ